MDRDRTRGCSGWSGWGLAARHLERPALQAAGRVLPCRNLILADLSQAAVAPICVCNQVLEGEREHGAHWRTVRVCVVHRCAD